MLIRIAIDASVAGIPTGARKNGTIQMSPRPPPQIGLGSSIGHSLCAQNMKNKNTPATTKQMMKIIYFSKFICGIAAAGVHQFASIISKSP
jgi:hypothetical protein